MQIEENVNQKSTLSIDVNYVASVRALFDGDATTSSNTTSALRQVDAERRQAQEPQVREHYKMWRATLCYVDGQPMSVAVFVRECVIHADSIVENVKESKVERFSSAR